MPTFELSANGKTFEIDAPDQSAAVSAFQKMQADQPSTGMDMLKSFGSGVASGTTKLAGAIPDIAGAAKGAANKYLFDPLLDATIGKPSKAPVEPSIDVNKLAGSKSIQSGIESVTGEFYKPKTTAGRYTHAIGEMAPGAALGPGGAVAKAMSATGAGIGSEAAGDLTKGSALEPYAKIAGALAGGMAPSALGRAVTPLPAAPARQRLVDILEDEGVTSLTAGQRTGNKPLQYMEDFLGNAPGAGQSANRIRQEGQEQFTRAAMRRAGQGLDDATPETLLANNQRLDNEFRALSARNTLTPDNQFITDITNSVTNYRRIPNSQQAQLIQGYIDDIVPYVNAGAMPGVEYQRMRSIMSRQANNNRQNDPDLAQALRGMRDALDNAMERSIAGTPDAGAWGLARREKGAQKVIEKTASRAGEATAEGQLVPANLRNTVSAENRGAYARGQGPFSELARAGSGVMAPLPNSGTAQRLSLTNVAMLPISATAGRALMSRPVQAYLGNQALAPQLANLNPRQAAIVNALMAERRREIEAQPR